MIKIIRATYLQGKALQLIFSDNSHGDLDFSELLSQKSSLTLPLQNEDQFCRFFLDLGALCWPNGLEFSPTSLHEMLEKKGSLICSEVAYEASFI